MTRKPAAKGETVTFIEAVEVRDHNGDIEQAFKAGEVVDMNPASAQRWISRGKAVAGKTTVAKATESDEVQAQRARLKELETAAGELSKAVADAKREPTEAETKELADIAAEFDEITAALEASE